MVWIPGIPLWNGYPDSNPKPQGPKPPIYDQLTDEVPRKITNYKRPAELVQVPWVIPTGWGGSWQTPPIGLFSYINTRALQRSNVWNPWGSLACTPWFCSILAMERLAEKHLSALFFGGILSIELGSWWRLSTYQLTQVRMPTPCQDTSQ